MAGLSTAFYALASRFDVHIVEHNDALGGVCTAWQRGPYTIDGCLRWLMGAAPGGMFRPIYAELGLIDALELRTIETFARIEDPDDGWRIDVTRDIDAFARDLTALAPTDAAEIARLRDAIQHAGELKLELDAPELKGIRERLAMLWSMRNLAGTVMHFRGSVGQWIDAHVTSPRLRAVLETMAAPQMPMLFLPMLLGSLARGQLQLPRGGSARFRDALVDRVRALGAQITLGATVEEILVEHGHAVGVRLADGTQLRADVIVSTASLSETAERLLGGRYVDAATRDRLDRWPTFDPIAIVTAGISRTFAELDAPLLVRQRDPLVVGDRPATTLSIQAFAAPEYAPEGHCVVQATLGTSYAWWAERGDRYARAKEQLATAVIERMDRRLPGLADRVEMIDVVTPLTFWRHARSWRGAFEGWMPTPETFNVHVPKQLPGLEDLWLAGQWVEPGGGIPPSLMSGRQVVQLVSQRLERPFLVAP